METVCMPQYSDNASRIDRRAAMGLGALALAGSTLSARAETPNETIALWPSTPPGGQALELAHRTLENAFLPTDRHLFSIAYPTLTVFRPARPDGSAILIAAGGGFSYEAFDLEGTAPAELFAASGVTAFVLTYRLPGEGWKDAPDVPLQDAQRAIRIIRASRDFALDPTRIGILGFSAGGHVAASLATRYGAQVYAPVDEADRLDARPSFAALLYPVITMLRPFAHEASCEKLLGPNAPVALRTAYSVERAVTADTPPVFLCVAADDADVAPDNTLAMFAALRARKVPSEMHVFENGGHGFGLGAPGTPEAQWPQLFLRWGSSHRYFRDVA